MEAGTEESCKSGLTISEAVEEISSFLNSKCEDPAEQMIQVGKVLIEVGSLLKGRDISEQQRIIRAVAEINGVKLRNP